MEGDRNSSLLSCATSGFDEGPEPLAESDNRDPARDCRDWIEAGRWPGCLTEPPIDCLFEETVVDFVVVEGGPISVLPPILDLDFELESEVLAVVAGVPVRGVEAVELTDGGAGFAGGFVGDLFESVSRLGQR